MIHRKLNAKFGVPRAHNGRDQRVHTDKYSLTKPEINAKQQK